MATLWLVNHDPRLTEYRCRHSVAISVCFQFMEVCLKSLVQHLVVQFLRFQMQWLSFLSHLKPDIFDLIQFNIVLNSVIVNRTLNILMQCRAKSGTSPESACPEAVPLQKDCGLPWLSSRSFKKILKWRTLSVYHIWSHKIGRFGNEEPNPTCQQW